MTGIIKTDQIQGAQSTTVTVPTGHTLAVTGAFTSQGIDDNANATAITIDSNEDITITKQGTNTTDVRFANSSNSFGGNIKYDHNVGNMIFNVHNGERVRFRSDGGICFNGDTAAANALNDYEEGTFTPTLVSSGSTFAYSVQQGIYTKVGDLVTFNVVIQLDGGGNSFSSNSVSINGWPFTSRNSQGAHGRFFIHGRYLNVDASGSYYYAFAQLDGNSASAPVKEGGDNIPIANLGANRLSSSSGQLYLHGHYYTDS